MIRFESAGAMPPNVPQTKIVQAKPSFKGDEYEMADTFEKNEPDEPVSHDAEIDEIVAEEAPTEPKVDEKAPKRQKHTMHHQSVGRKYRPHTRNEYEETRSSRKPYKSNDDCNLDALREGQSALRTIKNTSSAFSSAANIGLQVTGGAVALLLGHSATKYSLEKLSASASELNKFESLKKTQETLTKAFNTLKKSIADAPITKTITEKAKTIINKNEKVKQIFDTASKNFKEADKAKLAGETFAWTAGAASGLEAGKFIKKKEHHREAVSDD